MNGNANDTSAYESGAAYVFVRNGTTWSQEAILVANDGAAGDFFGYSVAVSEDTAVIGAQNDTINANFATKTLLALDNQTPVPVSIDPFFFKVIAEQAPKFQYAAKFICGKPDTPVLAPGTYFTAINVHNPGREGVHFRKKIAVALPSEKAGPVSRFFEARLGPDEALEMLHLQKSGKAAREAEMRRDGFPVVEVWPTPGAGGGSWPPGMTSAAAASSGAGTVTSRTPSSSDVSAQCRVTS